MSLSFTTKVKLKIDNKQWNQMEKRLLRGKNKTVEIGWWATQHPSGVPTAQVVAWNEEGHLNGGMFAGTYTPPRPAIRVGFIPKSKKLIDIKYLPIVFDSIAMGKSTWSSLHSNLQKDLQELLQKTILDWNTPPNRATTVYMKGFNDPLIETGNMYDSVKTRLVSFSKGG